MLQQNRAHYNSLCITHSYWRPEIRSVNMLPPHSSPFVIQYHSIDSAILEYTLYCPVHMIMMMLQHTNCCMIHVLFINICYR